MYREFNKICHLRESMSQMWTNNPWQKGLPIQGCRVPQLWQTWAYRARLSIIEKETSTTAKHLQETWSKYITTTEDQEPEPKEDDETLSLYMVGGEVTPPIKVPLSVKGTSLTMELDTGAAVTIVSQKLYNDLLSHLPLEKSQVLLKTYSGEQWPVAGEVDVRVQYEQQTQDLTLTVVVGERPCLLGRNWLQHLRLNWRDIKGVSQYAVGSLEYLLEYHFIWQYRKVHPKLNLQWSTVERLICIPLLRNKSNNCTAVVSSSACMLASTTEAKL